MELHDSGERREHSTGAVRDRATGKGRFDLMPYEGQARLARHFENGARKYVDRNWEKGLPVSWYIDAAGRHLAKAAAGYRDEDHLAAADWNLQCAMTTEERVRAGLLPADLDDRPYPAKAYNGVPREDLACVPEHYWLDRSSEFMLCSRDVPARAASPTRPEISEAEPEPSEMPHCESATTPESSYATSMANLDTQISQTQARLDELIRQRLDWARHARRQRKLSQTPR